MKRLDSLHITPHDKRKFRISMTKYESTDPSNEYVFEKHFPHFDSNCQCMLTECSTNICIDELVIQMVIILEIECVECMKASQHHTK